MKKIFTILSIITFGISIKAQTEVLNETFSFTGQLAGTNGWFKHSGATTGEIVSDGSVATLIAAKTEDVNRSIGTPYSMSTVGQEYKVVYKAKVNVLNSTNLTTTGDYFLSLGATTTTSNVTTGISNLPARLYVKGTTTGYILGVLNNSGGTVTPTYVATEIPYGTSANITLSYIVGTGTTASQTAKLIVDSQPEVSNSTGTTASPAQISSLVIRQGGSTSNTTGNVTIDDVIVETYAPTILAVGDISKSKINLVKNTIVKDVITFGAKANVKIINLNGQVVKSVSVDNGSSLNVSSLQKGVYIVTAEVNGDAVSQKIIKQ